MEFSNDFAYAREPDLKDVSPGDRRLWMQIAHHSVLEPPPGRNVVLARPWPLQLRLVKLFDEVGVPMAPPTRAPDGWRRAPPCTRSSTSWPKPAMHACARWCAAGRTTDPKTSTP